MSREQLQPWGRLVRLAVAAKLTKSTDRPEEQQLAMGQLIFRIFPLKFEIYDCSHLYCLMYQVLNHLLYKIVFISTLLFPFPVSFLKTKVTKIKTRQCGLTTHQLNTCFQLVPHLDKDLE